ncbi:hypothetical protein [Alkalibacterium sp. s-m-28]
MKKRVFGMACLSVLVMTACDSEEETTFDDEFKASIEEEPVQLTFDNGGLLLSFYPSEMIYYGINEYTDNYDLPFEQPDENEDYTEYQDYTVKFSEETDIFTVTTEDGVYELEMRGPRLFWDEENSLNILSTRSFAEE